LLKTKHQTLAKIHEMTRGIKKELFIKKNKKKKVKRVLCCVFDSIEEEEMARTSP
jgi:hypothetical protein